MITHSSLLDDLEQGLKEIPVLDAHTHLVGGKLSARGLQDVMLYHMLVSDLYAAGCPSGTRLTEYPGWPSPEESSRRIREAIPYLPFIRNTSMSWGLRLILADLYGWREPVTLDNWERLDGQIRERADDQAWQYSILDRAKIRRSCTEIARSGRGENVERLQYSLEWGFFTRCQWGEFDTALYELERCWGRPVESPAPISAKRKEPERQIRTLADVHEAVQYYVDTIPYDRLVSTAIHLSTDIDYRTVTAAEMEAALSNRANAQVEERNLYASYVNELFLNALEKHGAQIVLQFSFGAEPLPYETGSRLSQQTIAQVGEMIARHPGLRFQCLLASRHANQAMCIMARELPNLSLAACWWHNFFPDVIRQVMGERLDMLPVNKQVGFFSDAYCLEWSYGKLALVRKILAAVLAERVERGQYSREDAFSIARAILYETPQTLLGMKPIV